MAYLLWVITLCYLFNYVWDAGSNTHSGFSRAPERAGVVIKHHNHTINYPACCLGHTAGRRALISHFYGKFSIPPHLVLFPWKRNRQRHPSSLVWDTYHILLAMKHVQLERDFLKKLVNFWPLDGSTRWVFAHCTSRTKMRKQGKLNRIFCLWKGTFEFLL